ncbi:MAG: hypothetical protein WC565_08065 [Parcubacteria group bacterium]|jgi:predicted transcriptional regulator
MNKELVDKLSIYVPKSKLSLHPVERLMKLGEKLDRSVNFLVVTAILEYLDREEKGKPEKKAKTPKKAAEPGAPK